MAYPKREFCLPSINKKQVGIILDYLKLNGIVVGGQGQGSMKDRISSVYRTEIYFLPEINAVAHYSQETNPSFGRQPITVKLIGKDKETIDTFVDQLILEIHK